MLRADALRPVVPVTVSHLMGDRWMLIVERHGDRGAAGQSPRAGGRTESYQLAAAPEVRRGVLFVPLQLVVEIVPARGEQPRVGSRALRAPRLLVRDQVRASVTRPAAAVRARDGPRRVAPRLGGRTSGSVVASHALDGPLRSRKLVVVDAGHGGPDGGMHGPIGGGPQIAEKNITLNVAKRVGAALGERGDRREVHAHHRHADRARRSRPHRQRCARATSSSSIHVNAANPGWKDPGAARGFETYFLAEAKTEDARRVEQMENEVVKFEARSSAHAGDPLSFILNDMAQNEHLRESNELAELIQRRLGAVHPGPEPRREAGGVPRARHGLHAGGARGDRLRHEPGRCGVHDRSGARGGAVRRHRRRGASSTCERYERRVSPVPSARVAGRHRPAVTTARSALAVQVAGLAFQNPIVLAAGTAGIRPRARGRRGPRRARRARDEGGEPAARGPALRRRAWPSSPAG